MHTAEDRLPDGELHAKKKKRRNNKTQNKKKQNKRKNTKTNKKIIKLCNHVEAMPTEK